MKKGSFIKFGASALTAGVFVWLLVFAVISSANSRQQPVSPGQTSVASRSSTFFIDREKCIACGVCLEVSGPDALEWLDDCPAWIEGHGDHKEFLNPPNEEYELYEQYIKDLNAVCPVSSDPEDPASEYNVFQVIG